jgi:hypothetical protein
MIESELLFMFNSIEIYFSCWRSAEIFPRISSLQDHFYSEKWRKATNLIIYSVIYWEESPGIKEKIKNKDSIVLD